MHGRFLTSPSFFFTSSNQSFISNPELYWRRRNLEKLETHRIYLQPPVPSAPSFWSGTVPPAAWQCPIVQTPFPPYDENTTPFRLAMHLYHHFTA